MQELLQLSIAYMSLYVGVYLVLTLKGQYVAHNNFKENFGGAGVGDHPKCTT